MKRYDASNPLAKSQSHHSTLVCVISTSTLHGQLSRLGHTVYHFMRAIHLTRSLNQSGRFKYKVRSLSSLLFFTHKTNKCSQEPDVIVDFLVVGAGVLKLLWHLACPSHIAFHCRRSWPCCRPAPYPEFSDSIHLPSRET